jgi:tetratricopeptide (TPR) repeat protein
MTFSINRMLRNLALTGLLISSLAVTALQAQEIPYEVKVNYSLAAENYKNGDYESALPYLRWLLENAPTLYNGERIHRRAVRTYEELAGATEDEELKTTYLDSALYILDTTVAKFEDAEADIDVAQWELDYGNFLVAHRHEIPNLEEEAVDHFRRSYELNPAETDPYYIRLITQEYARRDLRQDAINFMDEAEQHFQGNEELLTFFDSVRNQLFKSPDERYDFLETQLAKNPGDPGIVREQFDIARQMGWAERVEEKGTLLLEVDPSVDTYREMAKMKKGNADYRSSLELNTKALELAEDEETKRDIEYDIALTHYDTGNLSAARTHARRALRHDPNMGNAYILIGDILAKAVQESAFEREDKAVYWLALDYYERARSVDSSVSQEANSRIQRYRQYMPTKEEKFFKGWKEGDSYTIDYGRYAWINETTHVR